MDIELEKADACVRAETLYFRQIRGQSILSKDEVSALMETMEESTRELICAVFKNPASLTLLRTRLDEVLSGIRDKNEVVILISGDNELKDDQEESNTDEEPIKGSQHELDYVRRVAEAASDGDVDHFLNALTGIRIPVVFLHELASQIEAPVIRLREIEKSLLQTVTSLGVSRTEFLNAYNEGGDWIGQLANVSTRFSASADVIRGQWDEINSILASVTASSVSELKQQQKNASSAYRRALAARDSLVEKNLRLVGKIASKYIGKSTLEYMDLVQYGNLGLMTTVERFDHRLGFSFSTYATFWIRKSISYAVRSKGQIIRLPGNKVEILNKISRENDRLLQETGKVPSAAEIARNTNLLADEVSEMLAGNFTTISIDEPIDGEFRLEETLASNETPLDERIHKPSIDDVKDVLGRLTVKERKVLKLSIMRELTGQKTRLVTVNKNGVECDAYESLRVHRISAERKLRGFGIE